MPDRVVTVRLQLASQDFQNGMLQAGSSVRVLQDGLAGGSSSADATAEALESLGTVAAAAGTGMVGAFTAVIVTGAKFDSQMSATGAAAKANAADLQLLRDAALEAGAATTFGATDAAAAEEELAKAGVSVTDMVNGGLQGALALAAAGGLEVADAAEIGATALSTFELSGQDMAHVADLLAAGAGKAQGSVDDLGQAMKQSALVSHQLGLSIDDQVGTLAEFASAGLIGSDAGTSLRTMLLRLNPQSKEAAQTMDELGINAFDASGEFVGMEKYAGILQDGLKDLSDEQRIQALTTIFGQDAIRAATVLYEGGAQGVRDWTGAVNDQGYAQDIAAQKMDNLAGDIEKLKGAIETGLITASEKGGNALRFLTQHLTNDVNALALMPPAVTQVGTAMTGGIGVMALFGGAAMLVKGKMDTFAFGLMNAATTPGARFTTSMGAASRGVSFLSRNLLGITAVVGIAAVAFDVWAQKQAKNNAAISTLAQSLDTATGALTDSSRATVQKALEDTDAAAAAQELGLSQQTITDAALGSKDALEQLNVAYKENLHAIGKSQDWSQDQFNTYHEQIRLWGVVNDSIQDQNGKVASAREEWQRANSAMVQNGQASKDAADKQNAASTALDGVTVSMQGQTDAATILKNALDNLSGKAISAEQANLTFQAGLNQLAATTKNNAEQNLAGAYSLTQIDTATGLYTAAVVGNRQAVIGAIQQTNAQAQAVYDATGNIDAATAVLGTNEAAIRTSAAAAGLNAAEVQKLIDKYAATPREVSTAVYAETDQAIANVQDLQRWIDALHDRTLTINYDVVARYSQGLDYYGAPVATPGRASGGPVSAGSMYMVGEEGEELFMPSTDGHIVNASDTRSLLTPVPMVAGSNSAGGAAGMLGMQVTLDAGSIGTLTGYVTAVSDGRIVAARNRDQLAGAGGSTVRPA